MTHQKIFASWSNVAWGASTNRGGVVQHVGDHLTAVFAHRNRFANKKRQEIRADITREVEKKIKEVYGRTIQVPGLEGPLTSSMFIGYATDGPFILEIHPDLTDTDHVDTGYAATGSGDIFPYFALASLRHYNVPQRTLFGAKLIGYRIVQDAINVAAYGLGPPVQMIEIPLPQRGQATEAHRLSDDDIRTLDERVIEWKEAESEVLTRFVGLAPGAVPPPETAPAPPPQPAPPAEPAPASSPESERPR